MEVAQSLCTKNIDSVVQIIFLCFFSFILESSICS